MSHLKAIRSTDLELVRGGNKVDCLDQNGADLAALDKDWSQRHHNDGFLSTVSNFGRAKAGYPNQEYRDFAAVDNKINDELKQCLAKP